MAAPEESEWKKTPRERIRPKVNKNSPFFAFATKYLTANQEKKENAPLDVHQEPFLKENIGEDREHEVNLSLERKDERLKTDSKLSYRNTEPKDNVRHSRKENYNEFKTESYDKFKDRYSEYQNNQGHLSKHKYKSERPEYNPRHPSQDDVGHHTKTRYERVRTESNSKSNYCHTSFQDHRPRQSEMKYENQVKTECYSKFNQNYSSMQDLKSPRERMYGKESIRESDSSGLHDSIRYSNKKEYYKDRKFNCGDDQIVNRTNSKSTIYDSGKSHERHYNYSKSPEYEEKKSSFKWKNKNYIAYDDKEIKLSSVHESSAVVSLEDEKVDVMEFESIKNIREVEDVENLKITIKNDEAKLLPLSNSSNETASSNNVSDSQAVKNDDSGSVCLFSEPAETASSTAVSDSRVSNDDEAISVCLSSPLTETTSSNDVFDSPTYPVPSALEFVPFEENYIPPPVQSKTIRHDSGFHEDSSNIAAGRNDECMPQNGKSEALPDLEEDESYYSLPDTKQIEAISNFISKKVKEKFVNRATADKVVRELNSVFRDQLDGQTVHIYGSYSSDLAVSTSDINLVMVSDCSRSFKKSFMYEVYKVILEKFENFHVYPYEEGSTIYETKVNFSHPESGVKCQLAYLGKYRENMAKMGQFLRRISSRDERVKTLILAVKIWSEDLCINEVEDGKLHTIGFALMVVHFLQHCEDPILPNFPCELGEKEMLNSTSPNNLSVGELWLSFLNYYADVFDWKQNVISVNSNSCVSKQSKGWENYWLAIEDPFTEKNVAKSVINSDIADYIKNCFKSTYDYFCNPPESAITDSSNEDDESNGDITETKWEFSFDRCNADQDDIFCEDCDELNETCDNCQKKMYVEPQYIAPKMTEGFLEIVKDSLMTVYRNYMLTDQEVDERKEFVKKLETRMTQFYKDVFSDAEFSLFGSSANGFGFKNSDIDICITFKSKKVVNSDTVLKDVRFLLRKDRNFEQVFAVFNAQIPIVKFYYKPKGWRGDISLKNSLAIHNSNLLYTYSLLDERCKILGCALKLLAKKALISEVTDKALSSYSYLNMVIYFLQQTDPPVLPILQDSKFRNRNYEINHIIENCNVWFCKDLDYIKTEFQTENQTPVEQLWLELLDFYCAFDTDKFISIRQKEPICVDGKKRTARLFNIQDPFIETKNLGCVVSAKKAQETINVLRRARKLFRTPLKELPTCVKDNEDFFFSTQSLTGRIHKEAHCELCGKYGHEKKECTHSSNPFPRFRFRRNTNNQFVYRRRNPSNPCKNFVSKFCSKSVYQRA